jgi:nucleotide-binding universal stress UspA family protein
MKILLAIDGSDHTKRMLSHIAVRDELLGPTHDYTLFTVVSPVPPHAASYLERDVLNDYYRDEAQRVLEPARAFAEKKGWRAELAHVVGHAADEIAQRADKGEYDVIVMGTHGRSALRNVVLGSVVTGVLARSDTPVLLIR